MLQHDKYSNEFTRQAECLAGESKVLLKKIAAELEINPGILSCWLKEMSPVNNNINVVQADDRDIEIANLKFELSRVKLERDFLQKALTFMEQHSDSYRA